MKITSIAGRASLTLALMLSAAIAPAALGQAYPSKPIHLIVPFAPGGSSDILARAIGNELNKAWGQAVIIENVPGAGGSVGGDKAAKSAPDGYTLFMGHIGTLAVNPLIYPKLPYDPVKDFTPVAWVASVPNVLVVNPAVPAQSVKELVALAKTKPGTLNYGSGGNGSAAHLATEYLKLQTQTSMTHVPYRGTAPAVTDLLAGQLQLMLTGGPAVLQFVKAGKLRALAVSSSRRLDAMPELPTIAESGYPGFEADQWYGVVAPTGTPRDIVAKLNAQINKALTGDELKTRLQGEGAIAMPSTPETFGSLIVSEIARWRPVVQAGQIKPE
jgi:tripartite-type tricarboxylate transporter receptor subunit TctC